MKSKAVVLVLMVFVLGCALGALTMHLVQETDLVHARRTTGSPGPKHFQGQLTRDLGLNPEQQAQLEAILEETRQRYDALYNPLRPQLIAIREEGRDRIRGILTTEQLQQFDIIVQKIDESRGRKKRER